MQFPVHEVVEDNQINQECDIMIIKLASGERLKT